MDPGIGRNKYYGRGAPASGGRGSGCGCGRGNYQTQGAGGRRRGNYQIQGAGGRGNHQPTAEQRWVNRSPNSGTNQLPWGHRPPQMQTPRQRLGPPGGRVDAWTGRSRVQPPLSSPSVQPRSPSGIGRFTFFVFLLLISLLWCKLFGCNDFPLDFVDAFCGFLTICTQNWTFDCPSIHRDG